LPGIMVFWALPRVASSVTTKRPSPTTLSPQRPVARRGPRRNDNARTARCFPGQRLIGEDCRHREEAEAVSSDTTGSTVPGPVTVHRQSRCRGRRAECRVDACERGSRSVSWRLILKSGLRQQPIPVGNMHALQCFELLEDRTRNRAIQAVRFVM
jgi:hypothetical protein